MKQIRQCIFETNSSSTHSMVMCMKADHDAWEAGEVYLRGHKFVTFKEAVNDIAKYDMSIRSMTDEEIKEVLWEYGYYTYEQWCEREYLEGFYEEFTTPSGDVVVAFGEYGYDG